MGRKGLILLVLLVTAAKVAGQVGNELDIKILFRGVVRDASTASPLFNTQVFVNNDFVTSTDSSGTFSFRIRRNDSILFRSLGYKPALYHLSDTLVTGEIMAGVYMTSDTISIGEVIIIPKRPGFRSEILNSPAQSTPERENAKYNLQLATYQGKVAQGKLGDPTSNYGVLRQQLSQEARERGQIPSSQMVGVSPFTIIPLAYMLLKGIPGKPVPLKANLTNEELNQIHKKYLESLKPKQ